MSTAAATYDEYFDLDDIENVIANDYLRVSFDKSGVLRSNHEQHHENVELIARKRWHFGKSYNDEGSASKFQTKRRQGFDLLIADLRADRFAAHVLIIWEVSRGTRKAGEMETLLALCQERGVWLYVYNKRRLFNPHVVDDWEDLMHAAVSAAGESMRTSQRTKRASKADAKAGNFTGGRRAFGFEANGVDWRRAPVDEVEIIRECAKLVLGGKSMRWIAGELNRRGVTTSAGNPWHPNVLRHVLVSERTAGNRVHKGVVVKRDAWPAIIDETTHKRLIATLATRAPVGRRGRTPWVLTGLLKCERCGVWLVSNTDTRGTRRYVCRKAPGYKGCGGLVIKADPLEELLGKLATERLTDVGARRAAVAGPDDSGELAELDQIAADRLAVADAGAQLSLAARLAEYAAIDRRERDVESRLAAKVHETSPLALVLDEGLVGRRWDTMEVHEQRSVLDALMNHVTVAPASSRGSTAFEPERVTSGKRIDWKI
jgi:site-specific DNA recombinase